MSSKIVGYQCSLCGSQYVESATTKKIIYTCPKDGGNLDVILDYMAINQSSSPKKVMASSDPSMWRYLPLLPVDDPGYVGTPLRVVGGTPVYAAPLLRKNLGLDYLWVKDESRNPTASFKDRASALVMARAFEIGKKCGKTPVVVTASTGNAGAALAGMAAAAGQKAVIFAPRTAPPAKIAQLLIYGAQVLLVDGTYDQAFDLTIQVANEFGWYCRNTGYNPFTLEGKKTAALEIWEWFSGLENKGSDKARSIMGKSALNSRKILHIFVSVGDGNIISGLHKGFKDLQALGWLESMPRLIGVQAQGSAAVANAFSSGSEIINPVSANTLADSISVDLPRDGIRALRAARATGGTYLTVNDTEILSAVADMGKVGIFAEPAGATAYAGLVNATRDGLIETDTLVLVLNTGSGLKDIKAAMQAVQAAPIIEPDIDAVRRYL